MVRKRGPTDRVSRVCARPDSLVLELPGELSLRLLQLLPGCDVLPYDVPHLCLHQLQFGKQLHRKSSADPCCSGSILNLLIEGESSYPLQLLCLEFHLLLQGGEGLLHL